MASFFFAATVVSALLRRVRRYDHRGRVVVISGGSRGLGLLLARECARRGARLALLARDVGELQRAREELLVAGAEVLALPCDVSDTSAVTDAIARVVDWYGRLDVLVNDAGVIEVGPLEAMNEAAFRRGMETHLFGPLSLVRAALPVMRAQGGGRVVNIASIGGLVAVPHLAPYCASKFALAGLSESLRVELAKEGIVVTAVFPGLMRTGSGRAAWVRGDAQAESAWFRASSVMPLVSMDAERAARRIVKALVRGESRVVVGLPAKILALAHGVAPSLVMRAMALVDRFLPRARGPARGAVRAAAFPTPGRWLRAIDERVASANNEIGRQPVAGR